MAVILKTSTFSFASGFATAPSVAMFEGDEVLQVCAVLSLSHQSQLMYGFGRVGHSSKFLRGLDVALDDAETAHALTEGLVQQPKQVTPGVLHWHQLCWEPLKPCGINIQL